MICPSCGEEGCGAYCQNCGTPLEPRGEESSHRSHPSLNKKVGMIPTFLASLTLLLPLLYLFMDVFVILADGIWSTTEEAPSLVLLVARLMSPSLAQMSLADILSATLGTSASPIQGMTLLAALQSGDSALVLGAALFLALVLLSAAIGIFLLLTFGRGIHNKFVADLSLIVGTLAAIAPLVCHLTMRLVYAFGGDGAGAADAAMRYVQPSIESMLLFAILLCIMLPAVRTLRRAASAGHSGIHVTALYRTLAAHPQVARLCALIFGVFAVLLPFGVFVAAGLMLAGSTGGLGYYAQTFFDCLALYSNDAGSALAAIGGEDVYAALAAFMDLFYWMAVVVLLIGVALSAFSFLRLLLSRTKKVAGSLRGQRAFNELGKKFRRPALFFIITVTLAQVIMTVWLICCTGIVAHVDFLNVEATLTVIYLSISYVKLWMQFTTVGWFVLATSLVCGTVAGNFARTMTEYEPN